MQGSIPKNPTLLVISDTAFYEKDGTIYGFGPVVKELEGFLTLFEKIRWIGFVRPYQEENKSYLPLSSKNCKAIPLPAVGGPTFGDKLSVLKKYPSMWRIIGSEIQRNQFIHVRAPSNPAIIAMLLSKKYPQKKFWFKYAGTWVEKAPFFYNLQRRLLKKTSQNSVVTVNGTWKGQSPHILAFENPCLTEKDREEGKETVLHKSHSDEKKYCFVGGLNENKGIVIALQALKEIGNALQIEFHIVGTGPLANLIQSEIATSPTKVIVHGALPKKEVHKIYKKCHFLVLPSKSEGFPKVVGEAMNFGCIPIVSNISCMNQYIEHKKNGFLIQPITVDNVKKAIKESYGLSAIEFKNIININYNLADKFTYTYYLKRIENDIFKIY